MWCCWWGIMIPGCVWEYSSLEKWRAVSSPPRLSLSFSASDSDRHTHTHTLSTRQMIMIFRKRREGWACDEYFIYFNDLRKHRKMLGSSEAKHGLSLQTNSIASGGGPDEAGPHTWQRPAWAAVQRLFTVSDSNRDPLKDKRSCVSQPSQLASGWSAVLFNDPHRGQGRGTWGDTQEIPGFVSSPMWESELTQWVSVQWGIRIMAVKDWLLPF